MRKGDTPIRVSYTCARSDSVPMLFILPQKYFSYLLFLTIFYSMSAYHISPNKCSRSYAKHRRGAFILDQICKAKSLSNFVYLCVLEMFNSLPNNKFLDCSKLIALADDKINLTCKQKFFLEWVENIVGKRENAGYQHFLPFPQCFLKVSFSGLLKVGTVW